MFEHKNRGPVAEQFKEENQGVPIQEQAIPVEKVPTDPVRCPKCNGGNMTLRGRITRQFERRLLAGEKVCETFAGELESETEEIECHECKMRFLIMTPVEHDLAVANEELAEEIVEKSGYIGAANKLQC